MRKLPNKKGGFYDTVIIKVSKDLGIWTDLMLSYHDSPISKKNLKKKKRWRFKNKVSITRKEIAFYYVISFLSWLTRKVEWEKWGKAVGFVYACNYFKYLSIWCLHGYDISYSLKSSNSNAAKLNLR